VECWVGSDEHQRKRQSKVVAVVEVVAVVAVAAVVIPRVVVAVVVIPRVAGELLKQRKKSCLGVDNKKNEQQRSYCGS
jgi:hypothetical protein